MKIAITGSNGFIGSNLIKRFRTKFKILGFYNKNLNMKFKGVDYKYLNILEINKEKNIFSNAKIVIHTAAVVPSLFNRSNYNQANINGTLNLAKQASLEGVNRFIFLSSIKVYGLNFLNEKKITSDDEMCPDDNYGLSKMKAEIELRKFSHKTKMEIIIIRPALVYGPGVKGNYLLMMKLIFSGLPIPFSGIKNNRSFLAIDNLVDLIDICIIHPLAGNKTFLASDGQDISTADLVNWLGIGLGKTSRIFSISPKVIFWCLRIFGLKKIAYQLCGNTRIDISNCKKILGWKPRHKIMDSTLATAKWYKKINA